MSSFGASAHEKKFVVSTINLIKENRSLIVNGKEVALRKEGITGAEVAIGAAVVVAITAAIGAYHWGSDLAACREMVGSNIVLLREDGVVVGHAADYDWRGRIEIGQKHFAPTKNRAWAKDGVVNVKCNGFLAGLLASELEKQRAAAPAATPPAAPPADATPPAAPPAPPADATPPVDASPPAPSPEVEARHRAEEDFLAACLAAKTLGLELPPEFERLMGALLLLSAARDEGAPPEAFAALNRTRGIALREVRAFGRSGIPEVDEAFVAMEDAAAKAKAARAARKAVA